MNHTTETYIGFLNFFTFGISIIAAVLAIDLYGLLRVGQSGRIWRILIVASLLFVFLQVLGMAEVLLSLQIAGELRQVVELVLALALAYAFYCQRALYNCKAQRQKKEIIEDTNSDDV